VAFQTPITIERALQGIASHEFVLPAIQREFVWKPEQICAFFESPDASLPHRFAPLLGGSHDRS